MPDDDTIRKQSNDVGTNIALVGAPTQFEEQKKKVVRVPKKKKRNNQDLQGWDTSSLNSNDYFEDSKEYALGDDVQDLDIWQASKMCSPKAVDITGKITEQLEQSRESKEMTLNSYKFDDYLPSD